MKHDRKYYWEDHKFLFEEALKGNNIPEDLQFLQDFYDGWIARQIKEAKKMGIRKASEGYEV